jgi:hypothetical protein
MSIHYRLPARSSLAYLKAITAGTGVFRKNMEEKCDSQINWQGRKATLSFTWRFGNINLEASRSRSTHRRMSKGG